MAQLNLIDVKSAVKTAMDYLAEFHDLIPVNDVRLEETEYNEGAGEWLITLSSVDSRSPTGSLAAAFGGGKRDYKIFRIDAAKGNVKSMKVRTLVPTT
jgi:hypothetical protein